MTQPMLKCGSDLGDSDAEGALLELYTDYSVGNLGRNSGATIKLVTAVSTTRETEIARVVEYTQPTSILNQGGVFLRVVEKALDYIVMQIQQVADGVEANDTYNLKRTKSSVAVEPWDLQTLSFRADKVLGFNTGGTPTLLTSSTDFTTQMLEFTLTTDVPQTVFPVDTAYVANGFVFVEGVKQGNDTYVLENDALIFTEEIPAGTLVELYILPTTGSNEQAEEWAVLAKKWANEDYNVVVADGEYSARHYAQVAKDMADRAGLLRNTPQVSTGQTAFLMEHDLPIGLVMLDGLSQPLDAFSAAFPTLTFVQEVLAGTTVDILYAAGTAAYSLQTFENVDKLLKDTQFNYGNISEGASVVTHTEGFRYLVAAPDATDEHVTTTGGVKLYVQGGASGYDVKAFGTAGDGVTDDTATIQAMLDAAPVGGTVNLPRGNFLISSRLTCSTPGVSIRGLGASDTEATFVVGSVIQKAGDFNGLVCSGYQIEVKNLTVLGQPRKKGDGPGVGHGIVIAGRGVRLDRVTSRFNGGCGVLVNAEDSNGLPDAENTHYAEFTNSWTEYNGQAGFRYSSPASGKMNFNLISNWTSRHNDGDGFDHSAGAYSNYIQAGAEYNLGYGIRFAKGTYSTIIGGHTEQNLGYNGLVDAGDGVRIENGIVQLRFIGGTYAEGGEGSDFEAGIGYAPDAKQYTRDIRLIEKVRNTRFGANEDLTNMQFEACNHKSDAGSIAGLVGTIDMVNGDPRSASFYAELNSDEAVLAKISAGTPATPTGVGVAHFDGAPSSGNTGLLLLVNDRGVTEVRQVSLGADNSGGMGFKALVVRNN